MWRGNVPRHSDKGFRSFCSTQTKFVSDLPEKQPPSSTYIEADEVPRNPSHISPVISPMTWTGNGYPNCAAFCGEPITDSVLSQPSDRPHASRGLYYKEQFL
jgi:hypothetical protein